jgi:cytochrome c
MQPAWMHRPWAAAGSLGWALGLCGFSAFGADAAQAQSALSAAAQRGQAIYAAKCSACHSVDAHRVGPAHEGVLGRRAGQAKGYDYSDALATSRVVWSAATLNAWLSDPEQLIPGQRMSYQLSLAKERADVIAYLATLKPTK